MKVALPPRLASLAGTATVEIEGRNLHEVLLAIESSFPVLKGELLVNDRLRSGLAVAIDGVVAKIGLYEPLQAQEIRFVPAIGGG